MSRPVALVFALFAALAAPARAQTYVTTVTVEEWVEDGAERLVAAAAATARRGEAYGPFRVVDEHRAALVGVTDAGTPARFRAMLRDHPKIGVIEMIECPGTADDNANLALGRMIRAAGIATHVPPGGSVRSGAVELFLAGATRAIDDGAEFAVHAWRDSDGRGPGDYRADSQVNRTYLDYYREMGIDRPEAFYAMTNSAAYAGARWLTAQEMRGWVSQGGPAQGIAYLDLNPRFP